MELFSLTAHELLDKLKKSQIKPDDILVSLKKRIDDINPKVKAYVRLSDNSTLNSKSLQPATYDLKPNLFGIPVSIKDNISTEGIITECCSKILEGFTPAYDACVIQKLKKSQAIILNIKTNMDEFAFGSSTENSSYGVTCNPWDLECVPGGSSGGSAAAVASDQAIMALGSDTGGSIRQPASFCGVVGLKPTYGRVSRYGLIAFASSLDQIGPITKDVTDCAILMNVISGHDPFDSTSVDVPVPDYTKALEKDLKGLKVAIPKEYFVEGIDQEVKHSVEAAIDKIKSQGAKISPVSLPHTEYAVPVYYIVATAEASSNLARFDGVQYGLRAKENKSDNQENKLIAMYKKTRGQGFGQEAKRRILLGTFALSHGYYDAYYLRAQKVRTLIKQDFDKVFEEFDCILAPTSPTAAFKIGEKAEDPLKMYLSDIFTISANLSGIPAISVPCGFTKKGLPIGLQILAKPFAEETLLRVAYNYEQSTEWHLKKPNIK